MALSYNSIISGGSAAGSDFTVNVGSSGYTKATATSNLAAGQYIVTSSQGDTSYDIYLLAQDGTLAGSVNGASASSTITASKTFNAVVIYGTQNNDIYTFQYKN